MRFPTQIIPLRLLGVVAAFLLLGLTAEQAQAQFVYRWLAVGDMHAYYTEAGSHNEDYNGHNVHWPGMYGDRGGNVRGYALWIGASNFTDEAGVEWPVKLAHVGPRVTGVGEVFPETFVQTSEFAPPKTFVDGFESIFRPTFNDEVDPNLPADRALDSRTHSVLGITLDRRVLAWSNEYHDDYHITEYTFTNTGNTDPDEEVELPNQTLEGVYFNFQNRYSTNRGAGWQQMQDQGWGRLQMNDAVGDGHEDYDVDFRAQYSWLGNNPNNNNYDTTIGGPLFEHAANWLRVTSGDSIGRLGASNFIGKVYIHADAQAYPEGTPLAARTDATELDYATNPNAQPHTMGKLWTGDFRTHSNSHEDLSLMQDEYALIAGEDYANNPNTAGSPREYPHHADLVLGQQADVTQKRALPEDFARHDGDPTLGQGGDGYAFIESFGPYTMAPGESVKLVIAEAVGGLSEEANIALGRQYKAAGGDDSAPLTFNVSANEPCQDTSDPQCLVMTKNEWVMTSRDSLFQTFQRAIANFESGYSVPKPPKPPQTFNVQSGADRIAITWEPYAGASPDHWEIYRAANDFRGLAVTEEKTYRCVAGCPGTPPLPASTTSYEDTDVSRGLDYYYYIQAVGPPNNDPTGNTPVGVPLRSNRNYAQSYEPATLARAPGATLEAARVVPNPYNVETAEAVRFGTRDRLAFLDIPGVATIRIFTELGELVKTIEHDNGTGDAFWDMQTESQQLVSTGIYIAAITDEESGDTVYKKFVIVR